MGIFYALVALFSWGTGDFLIQRTARKKGVWFTIGAIGSVGTVLLLPIALPKILDIFRTENHLLLLLITSTIALGVSFLYFEALRRGKISAIAPILAFEIPVTVLLAAFFLGEKLSLNQGVLIAVLLVGIVLLSIDHFGRIRNIGVEPGTILAFFAMLGLGITNFLIGYTARQTNPFLVNWFVAFFLAAAGLIGMFLSEGKRRFFEEVKTHKKLVLTMGTIDNLAWVAYAQATLHIPIGIAAGLSESYIAVAAMLGLVFNKEKLKPHQLLGLIIVIIAATALASITPG